MTEPRSTLDVSGLPEEGFGPRSGPWWGTIGFMLAEGTTLAICAASYLYLSRHYGEWPPAGLHAPQLTLPTASMLWLLLSLIPAGMIHRAARRKDASALKWLLVIGVAVEIVALVMRAYEFSAVNVRWDTNSYGSIVWWTLGIHTTLLLADLAETAVFAAIFLSGHVEKKHFADADDVATYWYFVVLVWVPLYLLIYISPRLV